MATIPFAHGIVERYARSEKSEATLALEHLIDADAGIRGALVATADGFVVSKVCQHEVAERKLAAITSSLLSLAESLTKEAAQGSCQNLITESEEGSMVSLRINRTRVLTVMADKKTRLGILLNAAKICAERLARSAEVSA
jgi:predicted regulator of Ras-like GTPase activity (Roadblock/LC7/MglB family)